MKKLIMAAAIVCAAVAAQAGTIKWKTANYYDVFMAGSTDTRVSSAVVYLFNSATVAQGTLVKDFADNDGKINLASYSYADTGSINNGVIAAGSGYEVATDSANNIYFATIFDDKLFISEARDQLGPGADKSKTVSYQPLAASQATALDAKAGYVDSHWYAAAVPEPTSGLLLLLGVAGLALRRRRA